MSVRGHGFRRLGFERDMRENAPRCRWVLGGLTVDIMATDGAFLGLNTTWFKEALETATDVSFASTHLRLISPIAFIVIKHVAFGDRGGGDYFGSHDLEDLITVVDGRDHIAAEVNRSPMCAMPCGRCLPRRRSMRPCPAIYLGIARASSVCQACGESFKLSPRWREV